MSHSSLRTQDSRQNPENLLNVVSFGRTLNSNVNRGSPGSPVALEDLKCLNAVSNQQLNIENMAIDDDQLL